MIKIFFIILFSLLYFDSYAQNNNPNVTNVHTRQRLGTELVDVTNDVSNADDRKSDGQIVNDGYGDYVLAPAGQFQMGDNFSEGELNERPVHTVRLDSFYIGKYEVTNGEYKKFIDDGGYTNSSYWTAGGFGSFGGNQPYYWTNPTYRGGGISGNENFPVVGICWFEANAYCKWLSAKTGKTYRLPTEAEWEKVARGTDQRRYSWGNSIDGSYANYNGSGDPYSNLTPVGYYNGSTQGSFITNSNESPYGAYDMAGNVWEWCSDWYSSSYYSSSTSNNPTGPSSGSTRILRGGSWSFYTVDLRSSARGSGYPGDRSSIIGFRCAREVTSDQQTGIKIENKESLPKKFQLEQNYPNPFNPQTTIKFQIPITAYTTLKLYNILGQEIKILINQILQPDEYQVKWDGTDNNGIKVSSGIYIYQLKTNDLIQTKNMILLR